MNTEILQVLALAALPASGNFLGGIAAEVFPLPKRGLSMSLHAAAGVLFAVIGIELVPEALKAEAPWMVMAAFLAGGVFFVLVDKMIEIAEKRMRGMSGKALRSALLIFMGVSIDLLSDGVMIGTSSILDFKLAFLLALGQVTADIPEGFAAIANFKQSGFPRKGRLLFAASLIVPVFAGAAGSFYLLRGQPEIFQFMILAFTAGVLLTVAVEEMIREAHHDPERESRWGAVWLVSGFAVFALISTYFGV